MNDDLSRFGDSHGSCGDETVASAKTAQPESRMNADSKEAYQHPRIACLKKLH